MEHYTAEHDHRNYHVVQRFEPKANRLALRLSRELGISIDHATAAVAANNACKEPCDD
jgi:hypothetical protein